MSPKRKLAAAQQDTRQGDDSDNFDSDITSWNDEPAHFALWHNKLPEYLTDYDDSFSSLVRREPGTSGTKESRVVYSC